MHRLWGLIRTEFLRQFDSPISLLFFLALPLLFTAAVSAGLSGMMNPDESPPEELQMSLYVIQKDDGPLVTAFFDALRGVNFNLEIVDEIPEDVFGLEIPQDFSARLLGGDAVTLTLHTRPEVTGSPAVEQAVMAAQGRVGGAAIAAKTGLEQARDMELVTTPEEEAAFFEEVLIETLDATQTPPVVAQVRWPEGTQISTDTREMANSAEHASAGQIVTWVQTTLLGAAEVLVDERLRGTLKRMLVAPTSRATILGGKLLACLLIGLLQIAILIVGGAVLFGVKWGNDPLAVTAVSFAFALATVGLGMFLATLIKTRGQASSVVIGAAMTMSALGGAWFPLEITPATYRQIVQVLPANWAVRAYEDILARGATLLDVLPHVGVMLAFGIVFTLIGMWRFKDYQ